MANGTGKFFGGFLLGTAVGTVLGLLLAPQSGKDTRRLLKKSAKALPGIANDIASELGANVQYQADRLTSQANRTMEETMERLQEAIAVGAEASQRLRQEINAASNTQTLPDDDENL